MKGSISRMWLVAFAMARTVLEVRRMSGCVEILELEILVKEILAQLC